MIWRSLRTESRAVSSAHRRHINHVPGMGFKQRGHLQCFSHVMACLLTSPASHRPSPAREWRPRASSRAHALGHCRVDHMPDSTAHHARGHNLPIQYSGVGPASARGRRPGRLGLTQDRRGLLRCVVIRQPFRQVLARTRRLLEVVRDTVRGRC